MSSKLHAPSECKRKIIYRSKKKFSPELFELDCSYIPFQVCEVFDDLDDVYWAHNKLFTSVIDQHAPLKSKVVSTKQAPFMNSRLRKAIFSRNMWRNKFFRQRNNKTYQKNYSAWRNKVSQLRKMSIKGYIENSCNRDIGSKKFYAALKPFISRQPYRDTGSKIILRENEDVVSEPSAVASIFNAYFKSIADYSGSSDGLDSYTMTDLLLKHKDHPSILKINNSIIHTDEFYFSPVSPECIQMYILKLQANKAVGHDGIQNLFIKLSNNHTSASLCYIFNHCISIGTFPNDLKMADISPIFKKRDSLLRENYRSVNILTAISKVFERIMADQLITYFQSILSTTLSAYRKGYNCQHVVLQLTEFWRKSLDDNTFVGTVAMDLSKAFDKMPHALLVAKLYAYGLSYNSCHTIIGYLKNRQQRVKVMGKYSDWSVINRGVPQGSVLGPLLFNIFINDLFFSGIKSHIANYADDNHLYNSNEDLNVLKNVLENDTAVAIKWFEDNYMNANADKFHSMILNRKGNIDTSIYVGDIKLSSEDTVNVLGITLDSKLKFDAHVSILARRASQQINVLKRMSKFLSLDSRHLVYNSFISSNFTYCPVAWMFCGRKNVSKIEKVQERALRFVYDDHVSPYTSLLSRGNFLSLSMFRIYFLAIEVFKCVKQTNPPYLNCLFTKCEVKYNLRDSDLLLQPKFKTFTYGYKSFSYFGAKVWNTLSSNVKSCNTLSAFKRELKKWCLGSEARDLNTF